jgi:hypothetical protein
MYTNIYNFKPSDRIVVPESDLRWIQHHAIYLGKDANNVTWFAENKIGKGVQFIPANKFLPDVIEITRIEPFNGTQSQRKHAVQSALALKGKDYDLLHFNCEHYANLVQHKIQISNQVKTGLALGVITLFAAILFNNN